MSKRASKAKKTGIVGTLLALIAIFGGFLFTSGLGGCPPLPSSIYSGPNYSFSAFGYPPYQSVTSGLSYSGCRTIYSNSSLSTLAVNYSITYTTGYQAYAGGSTPYIPTPADGVPAQVYVSANRSGVALSNMLDNASLAAAQQALADLKAQYATSSQNVGWCQSGTGLYNPCQVNLADQNSESRLITVIQAAIAYNKALLPVISEGPPASSPPAFSFNAIISWLSGTLSYIYDNFVALFSMPVSFAAGTNQTSQNVTYVSQQVSRDFSASIPANLRSTAWSLGTSKMVNTQCATYVYQNSSKSFVYQGAVVNATQPYYNATVTYVPQQAGVYVFGISCETSNATFTTSWGAWSAPVQSVSAYKPVDVLAQGTSIQPPTGNPGGFSWASVTSFLAGIWNAITSWLQGLGL